MLFFFLTLTVVTVVVAIWAIVDAALSPTEAFKSVGESKAWWITLITISTVFLGPVGLIMAVVYLLTIRRKVRRGPAEA